MISVLAKMKDMFSLEMVIVLHVKFQVVLLAKSMILIFVKIVKT